MSKAKTQNELENRLTEPDRLWFPAGWKTSKSWKRAQSENALIGPVDPIRWKVQLGSGDLHEVLFCIIGGEIRAECGCRGYRHHGFCAHIARLWIRWTRYDLCVKDADTERTHRHPPAWIRVRDEEA